MTNNTATVQPSQIKVKQLKKSHFSTFMNYFFIFGTIIGIFPITYNKTTLLVKIKLFSCKSLLTLLILAFGPWIVCLALWPGKGQEMFSSNTTEHTPTGSEMILSLGSSVLDAFLLLLPFILANSLVDQVNI